MKRPYLTLFWIVVAGIITFPHSLCASDNPVATVANPTHRYVNKDVETCMTLLFTCEEGQYPFFDEQGCGCQVPTVTDQDCQKSTKTALTNSSEEQLAYNKLEIPEAGISFDIPQNWLTLETKTAWSPQASGIPRIGFKWLNTPLKSSALDILPKNSLNVLGPYQVDLGWERGSLYLVQINVSGKTDSEMVSVFEIHAVVSKPEVNIVYDFYTSALNLEQFKNIEVVHQHFIRSGALSNIKSYVSKDTQQCKQLKFKCDMSKEPFSDELGCGCVTVLPGAQSPVMIPVNPQ